jgi:hypothetical protein
MSTRQLPRLILILLALSLAGCATQYQPRYGHDGVYYDRPVVRHHVVHPDPLFYPYWSLDYFYFSRYYHPYSVFIGYHDPWFYPYPGWYYGYRAGPRTRVSVSYGNVWYPWYSYGIHYHYYQPWRPRHVHYPRHVDPRWAQQPRVRQIDQRLRELERREMAGSAARAPGSPAFSADRISTRRAATVDQTRPDRSSATRMERAGQRPAANPRIPRREVPTTRPNQQPSRTEPVIRQRSRVIEPPSAPVERAGGPVHRQDVAPEPRIPRQQVPVQTRPEPAPRSASPSAPPSRPAPPPPRQSAPPPRRSESPRSSQRRERRREP